jgi:hypothetical protein
MTLIYICRMREEFSFSEKHDDACTRDKQISTGKGFARSDQRAAIHRIPRGGWFSDVCGGPSWQ